ncbi:MAG: response regulator, partial [Pirellulaceae bacterium]|nr:response regulator [Pirellulaceae bacterium]
MRILIVDDELPARYGMAKCLRTGTREILEAENGQQALAVILEQQPDLVFLDLNMPVCDGLGVLQALAVDPAAYRPEIIVVTASDTIQHAIQCVRLGAADFLTKPY